MKKFEARGFWLAVGAVSIVTSGVLLAPLGCDSGCAESADDCGGTAGFGGAGGTGGSTGDAGGSAGAAGTAGSAGDDAGSNARCGGFAGLRCPNPETMYCDFPSGGEAGSEACGQGDVTGFCMPRPATCVAGGPGVCGCDGKAYTNDCEAHRAGTDDRPGACN